MASAYQFNATFTNGSAVVTAALAAFVANAKVGDLVRGPDERLYFVSAVNSNTQITLSRNYVGTTTTAAAELSRTGSGWNSSVEANVRLARIEESLARGYTLQSDASLAIGAGSKVFTNVEPGLNILDGIRLRATSRANPANYMEGFCTYSGSTLTMTVVAGDTGGAGTFADWNINISGSKGSTGGAGPTGLTGLCGFNNKLRNPNFAINQRVVSGTVSLAAGAYGHDGWKAGAGGCTYTFAASGGVTTVTISAGSLVQVCEGGWAIDQSGAYILTWNGSANASLNGGASGASPRTANLTGGASATVEFSTGTVILPQLEPGAVASAFERRSQMELDLCLRYARKSARQSIAPSDAAVLSSDGIFISGVAFSAAAGDTITIPFDVKMRPGTPSVDLYSTNAAGSPVNGRANININGVWTPATATHIFTSVHESGFSFRFGGALTAGAAYNVSVAFFARNEL